MLKYPRFSDGRKALLPWFMSLYSKLGVGVL